MTAAASADARAIITTRLIDAPRALVFEAWTDPRHLALWWGPNGFTTTTRAFDMRVGGEWVFVMHGPDGVDYPNRIAFDEITPPARIVYRHNGGEGFEHVQFVSTVTFDEVDGKTRLTLRAQFPSIEERERVAREHGAVEGGRQTVARLAEYMEALEIETGLAPAFTIERRFAAPRALVWRMLSEAEHLAHWWGSPGCDWITSTLDFRPGGKFHYGVRAPDASFDLWGLFFYRGIDAPHRIVYVSCFANETGDIAPCPFPMPWPREVLNVLTLEDDHSGTKLTLKAAPINETAEERASFQAHFASMQGGFAATFDKLDAYLAESPP